MRTAGLLALAILLLPALAHAALVNINTADAALLDTLVGIGPAYAARIVDYRTVHGAFGRIEDIQNVSGIGPSTYADIKSFITVGETDVSPTTVSTPTTTPVTLGQTSSGGATTYTPPPSALSVHISGDSNALLEVPLHLSAHAITKGGAIDSPAQLAWSFGDGSATTGTAVEKTYRYTGTYLVVVTAADGVATARDELVVTVKPATVRVPAVSGDGITIANDASERLDLSGWRLRSGTGTFRIPDGTTLLPRAGVLLPFSITNLPLAFDAALLYPDGTIAARFVPPVAEAAVQLPEPLGSSHEVQEVEPIINTKANIQVHEEAVIAPAAATKLAAAGATLPAASPEEATAVVTTHAPNLFRSPWTLGLLGVIAAAGGVFILL